MPVTLALLFLSGLAKAQLDPVEVFLLEEPGQQTAVQGRPAAGGALTQASIEDQLEAEIIKLERETKVAKRYSNFLRYESIFLRIGQTGLLAVARNMQYATTNAIFQADDDEDDNEDDGGEDGDDDDDDDDDKRRLLGDILLEYLFDEERLDESPGIERGLTARWGNSVEKVGSSKGRSIVPQFPGEPLFFTPATYWLQVINLSSKAACLFFKQLLKCHFNMIRRLNPIPLPLFWQCQDFDSFLIAKNCLFNEHRPMVNDHCTIG